jgi:hypothetical protein
MQAQPLPSCWQRGWQQATVFSLLSSFQILPKLLFGWWPVTFAVSWVFT